VPALLIFSIPSVAAAQSQGGFHPSAMKSNVVRIDAGARTGFGFVVGLGSREMLIATAWHTLRGLGSRPVSACFFPGEAPCVQGRVAYVADAIGARPALDLVVVAAPYPAGLAWRADVHVGLPVVNTPVWFVGRSREWYTPPQPGRITGFDAKTFLLSYVGLDVTEGVSGAPLVTTDGIAGMHVATLGNSGQAQGVSLDAIRDRVVSDMKARWILLPRTQCEKQKAHRAALADAVVTVHFSSQRPDAGLAALAQLNCLGVQTIPAPVWPDQSWPGEFVHYGSGDLRAARALQSALSTISRLDTNLVRDLNGLEVWVR
jgi:hypothetical protein